MVHCYKCNHDFKDCAVRVCPHPAVQRVYGETICILCCRGCAFKVTYPFTGALGCGYKTEQKEGET